MNQPQERVPSAAYWQELASLHDRVQKHGQERSGLYWKRKVRAHWTPQAPFHEDAPLGPTDTCLWSSVQYGIFYRIKEGSLIVNRQLPVQIGFDTATVLHTTRYSYGLNPNADWKMGHVGVNTLVDWPKGTPEDVQTVSLTDLEHQVEYTYPQPDPHDSLLQHLHEGAAELAVHTIPQLDELY